MMSRKRQASSNDFFDMEQLLIANDALVHQNHSTPNHASDELSVNDPSPLSRGLQSDVNSNISRNISNTFFKKSIFFFVYYCKQALEFISTVFSIIKFLLNRRKVSFLLSFLLLFSLFLLIPNDGRVNIKFFYKDFVDRIPFRFIPSNFNISFGKHLEQAKSLFKSKFGNSSSTYNERDSIMPLLKLQSNLTEAKTLLYQNPISLEDVLLHFWDRNLMSTYDLKIQDINDSVNPLLNTYLDFIEKDIYLVSHLPVSEKHPGNIPISLVNKSVQAICSFAEHYNLLRNPSYRGFLRINNGESIFNLLCIEDLHESVNLDILCLKDILRNIAQSSKEAMYIVKRHNSSQSFYGNRSTTNFSIINSGLYLKKDAAKNLLAKQLDATYSYYHKDLEESVHQKLNSNLEKRVEKYIKHSCSQRNVADHPDFALKVVGAVVDYGWTFPKPKFSDILRDYWGKKANLPTALLDTSINSNWCNYEDTVQVSVRLNRPMYVRHISLIFPIHGDDSYFPREIQMFGLINDINYQILSNMNNLVLLATIPVSLSSVFEVNYYYLPKYSDTPGLLEEAYFNTFVFRAFSKNESLTSQICLYHIGIHGKEINEEF